MKYYKRFKRVGYTMTGIFLLLAIIWFWEAWNRYVMYSSWIERGFSCYPYHKQCIIWGIVFTVFTTVSFFIGHSAHKERF